jgi:hypothetical protein
MGQSRVGSPLRPRFIDRRRLLHGPCLVKWLRDICQQSLGMIYIPDILHFFPDPPSFLPPLSPDLLRLRATLQRRRFSSITPSHIRRTLDCPHTMTSTISFSISWFSHNIVFVVASVSFSYILFRAIYNLFLSPLSAIPGPWYAAVSDLWITTHVLRLRQCKIVQELFEVYGPVVRIGPNKVVFHDLSTMRSVYSVHKFDKSTYYKGLLTYVCSVCSRVKT